MALLSWSSAALILSLSSLRAHAAFLQKAAGASTAAYTVDKDALLADLQAFVAGTGVENPALVMIGDSTIIGLQAHMREIFHDEEGWNKGTLPEEAATILANPDCPHAAPRSGGTLYTSVFGPPLNFTLHRIGIHSRLNDDAGCFDDCLVEAVRALKPSAVVYNFGLHLMHLFPRHTCVQAPGTGEMYHNCGDYGALVESSARALMDVTPLLVWRTTNSICEDKLSEPEQRILADWHNPAKVDALEQKCQDTCKLGDDRSCSDELIDAHSASRQRDISLDAIAQVSDKIAIFDAWQWSQGKCDLTDDGKHYFGHQDQELAELVTLLARKVQEK